MKVLLLSHRVPYPPNKGEKIRTYHQLSHLLGKGHDVVVVTPLENTEELEFAEKLSAKLNVKVKHAILSFRPLRLILGLLTRKPLSVTNFHSRKLQKQIDTMISTSECNALMCTSSAMAEYVLNKSTHHLIKKNNIQLVMDFMDLDSLKWKQFAEQKPWPISSIYKREANLLGKTEIDILHAFDACLFVSTDEASLLTSDPQLASKIHAVTNGVDAEAYHRDLNRKPSKTKPKLLFTGVMDYFPNENAVVWFSENVWPLVINKYPDAEFIIAGMRPSKKVAALATTKGIEVTGFIEDILPYYQDADLMVAPFKVARGIQNKVLQALASSLPVITSPAGAAGIACEDGTDVIIANTALEYMNAIDELLSNEQRYKAMQSAGRNLVVQKYSWAKENTKVEKLLEGA